MLLAKPIAIELAKPILTAVPMHQLYRLCMAVVTSALRNRQVCGE